MQTLAGSTGCASGKECERKAAGIYKGGKRRIDRLKIASLAKEGAQPTAIANAVGCSRMQVYRVLLKRPCGGV